MSEQALVESQPRPRGTLALLVSYRPILGYESGVYDDKLIVVAGQAQPESINPHHDEAAAYAQAQKVMQDVRERTISDIHTAVPQIGSVVVYAGVYAQAEALAFAQMLKEQTGQTPELVVCKCELPYKIEFAKKIGVERILLAECTGLRTMGRLADHILARSAIDPRTQNLYASPDDFLAKHVELMEAAKQAACSD